VKRGTAGDVLHVALDDASGNFAFRPVLLVGELFLTGTPAPLGVPAFDVHVSTNALIIIDGSVPTLLGPSVSLLPGGTSLSFLTPSTIAGHALVLQNLVLATNAANGILAASDAHLLEFE
jgi:hypothetical protein